MPEACEGGRSFERRRASEKADHDGQECNPWDIRPQRAKTALPASLNTEVEAKAEALIEDVLKPKEVFRKVLADRRQSRQHASVLSEGMIDQDPYRDQSEEGQTEAKSLCFRPQKEPEEGP